MSRDATTALKDDLDYPDGDGQPMAETPTHRQNLTDLISMIQRRFPDDTELYVSGNMFLYYEPGNRYRCFAPDVFAVRGVPRDKLRRVYKTWEEGKGPDLVIELTSLSTREEDEEDKFRLYRDRLKVPEYFLFDPQVDYLDPPLKGYRLVAGEYVPIEPVDGRLPCAFLGLHFERVDCWLRLYDPATGLRVPTVGEEADRSLALADQLRAERERAEADRRRADAERERADAEKRRADQLSREIEELRRRLGPSS